MGRGNPSPGKGLRGTPGATLMASLLPCYTRNRRPSALSPTSGREDKKRLVYMVRLARNPRASVWAVFRANRDPPTPLCVGPPGLGEKAPASAHGQLNTVRTARPGSSELRSELTIGTAARLQGRGRRVPGCCPKLPERVSYSQDSLVDSA